MASVTCWYQNVPVWPGDECNMLLRTCAGLPGVSVTYWYLPVQVCPGLPVNPVLHLQSVWELASPDVSLLIGQLGQCNMLACTCAGLPRGECDMLVPTCASLPGVSVTCWYLPEQVCLEVPVNPVLHLQSVRELSLPDVSLLIRQLDECNVLVPTCTGLPRVASEPSLSLQLVWELASPDISLLIGQLGECNMLVRTYAALPRGECDMLVHTCVGLIRVSVTCWYVPVQVCPGVSVTCWYLLVPVCPG